MPWADRDIAEAFVALYGRATGIPYQILDWPDDRASNQNTQSVDAIAEAEGAPRLAIEVTKIETFPAQRLDDHHTRRLAFALEEELGSHFPPGVMVVLEVSTWTPGFDFEVAQARLKDFLTGLPPRS